MSTQTQKQKIKLRRTTGKEKYISLGETARYMFDYTVITIKNKELLAAITPNSASHQYVLDLLD